MTKIKVVFFPYKASMWGSFDSIHQVCTQDNDCDVKVVPIPYCDKENDGKIRDWFYEIDDYSSQLNAIHHEKYNLEEEKPDIAFIHNPYDDWNGLSSVSPEFYTDNLVKYVKKLIYIPYYNARYEHIVNMLKKSPCFKNSWKIFYQSEAVAKPFIDSGFSADKIMYLGSPKSDYILNYKIDNNIVPSDWKSKADNRIVFLYNTHLDKARNPKEFFFMEIGFLCNFILNNNDLCLIWRPHPLFDSFLKNHADSETIKQYHSLLKTCRESDNIIIDDTSDYRMAFALSNAYIGDESSLILEYGLTGKPICVMDLAVKTYKKRLKPEQIYFDFDSLYSYSHSNDILNFIIMVTLGKDVKMKERLEALKKAMLNLDGKNGERIWKNIKDNLDSGA